MLYAKQEIINYIWYLGYEQTDEGHITILLHDRLRQGLAAHPHPDTENSFEIMEDENRVAQYVEIAGETYRVTNPQHVFSYPKFV
jgi:hypothetical protein